MSYPVAHGATSIVRRFKLLDSSSVIGAGLEGITSASAGLRISTIADNEATPTVYTVAGGTIEGITTLGTFATPTATKCRIRLVDDTNHPGICEFQFDNARYVVSNAKQLLVSVSGATNLVQQDYEIPLNFQSALIPSAINQASLAADSGLKPTRTATAQGGAANSITLDAGASATTDFYKNQLVVTLSGTGAGQGKFISAYNGTSKVATITNAWAVNPDATSVFATFGTDALPMVTVAQIVAGVLDEALAGHVTAGTVGKKMNDTSLQATLLAVETDVDAGLVVALKLDSALELDGIVYRLTTNALEQSSAGFVTTLKADSEWKTILANVNGQWTIVEPGSYPGNVVQTVTDKTGGVVRIIDTLNCLTRPSVLSRVSS